MRQQVCIPISHRRGGFPDSVLHMLQRLLKRIELERVRFHDRRHTTAILALQNGVDVNTVSDMLGHCSTGIILNTCDHVTTAAPRTAANTMGNVLSGAVRYFPLRVTVRLNHRAKR